MNLQEVVRENASSPQPSPPGDPGEERENVFCGVITQGGTRSSFALGYCQVIPTGFQFGSLRSPAFLSAAKHQMKQPVSIGDGSFTVARKL